MVELWIQGAIGKPDALRNYMRQKYGERAFTEKDTIKTEYLHKAIRSPATKMITKRRARLALTLRGLCPFCKGRRHPCKRDGTSRCLMHRRYSSRLGR